MGTSGIAPQLAAGQQSTARHSCFTLGKKRTGTHRTGCRVYARASGRFENEKNLLFLPGFYPQNVQLVAQLLYRLQHPNSNNSNNNSTNNKAQQYTGQQNTKKPETTATPSTGRMLREALM